MNPETWRTRTRVLIAASSGALMLLSFPPVDVRYVAWVALVPLVLALRGARGRAGAAVGFVGGLVFFGGLLYWLIPFGVIAWLPLVVAQAIAWSLAGWFGAWASRSAFGRIAGLPLVFTAAELFRERWPLGGFAWGLIGTTQHSGPPLLPLARIGGVFLVGLAVVAVNACIAEVIATRRWLTRLASATIAAGIAMGPAYIPTGLAGRPTATLDVASIQVNVRQGLFGPTRGRRIGPEVQSIVDDFSQQTSALASSPPQLVVWPENALDRDPTSDPALMDTIASAARTAGAPIIVGAILDAPGAHFRNSLLLVDPSGTITGRYDKQHLVPFGEYVPWPALRRYISALDQVPYDGIPGDGPVVLQAGIARVGGVICFESIFPEVVRGFVNDGANVLLVATNNASFGRTLASREHVDQSQLRAVEEGRYVLHAGLSGISAVVAPDGRIVRTAGLFRDATLRAQLPLASGRTPYARYGAAIEDGIAAGGAVTALAGFAGVLGRRRRRREAAAEHEFDWDASPDGAPARHDGPERVP